MSNKKAKRNVIEFNIGKDPYYRKSSAFANATVVFTDKKKTSGNVERLSATLLKAIQDQVFDISKQKEMKMVANEKTQEYSEQFKVAYITNAVERMKKDKNRSKTVDMHSVAEREYGIRKKRIDALAAKRAWRETLIDIIDDKELDFVFDAKSILEYARVSGEHPTRIYNDVKRVQHKFTSWFEAEFDEDTGLIIEEKEHHGTLFYHSTFVKGDQPEIEVTVSKKMIHTVLFLSNSYLKYHLDSFLAIEQPNPQRLFELLVDIIDGGLIGKSLDGGLSIEFLQERFNTNYADTRMFLMQVIKRSLDRINETLGTKIEYIVSKKIGRAFSEITFVLNEDDKNVLRGTVSEEPIKEEEQLSFEFYLALLSLGGQRTIASLRKIMEDMRVKISSGDLEGFGKDKEALVEDYEQNLLDAETLENLIHNDAYLNELYAYDGLYMNVMIRKERIYLGATATESLEYIRGTYLVPKGMLAPTLPMFDEHYDEYEQLSSILPFKYILTARKKIEINRDNFNSMKITIEPHLGMLNRFEFDTEEKKRKYCEIFNLPYENPENPTLEAEVVDDIEAASEGMSREEAPSPAPSDFDYKGVADTLISLGVVSLSKPGSQASWKKMFAEIIDKEGLSSLTMTIAYLSMGSKSSTFWLSNLSKPSDFKKHFDRMRTAASVEYIAFVNKIKNDKELTVVADLMRSNGASEKAIAEHIEKIVNEKIAKGEYGDANIRVSRRRRSPEDMAMEGMMKDAGFTNIFDFFES